MGDGGNNLGQTLEFQRAWVQISLVYYYFSHTITLGAMPSPGTDRLTPAREIKHLEPG